ncbi:MAG TPA: tRNA (5-methylaminomethyl-2-thiouridine)(34)-methyltransferase MnmD [Chitinophaga sp.]
MERHIQITADGSHTLAITGLQLTYHSMYGALQESMHVFIQSGLHLLLGTQALLRIFEMGLGTGLNALLTLQQAGMQHQQVYYETVELYPLSIAEVQSLNYNILLNSRQEYCLLEDLQTTPWDTDAQVTPLFTLHKKQESLFQYFENPLQEPFHLVYFDAFDPAAQPELWTQQVFEQLYGRLYEGGMLLTYCSKGAVRRAMQAAGFVVEKLSGPPGKREIVRATKRSR